MNVQKRNNQKGFTIIEVVLVLAIAGLIFLMVFIALPALQRNQRDTQRRNDLSRAQTAVQNYQTNNRGSLPTNYSSFISNYLTTGGDEFKDPDGTLYTFANNASAPDEFTSGRIVYKTKATCKGDAEGITTGPDVGNNKIAFQYKLEGGGVACVSN